MKLQIDRAKLRAVWQPEYRGLSLETPIGDFYVEGSEAIMPDNEYGGSCYADNEQALLACEDRLIEHLQACADFTDSVRVQQQEESKQKHKLSERGNELGETYYECDICGKTAWVKEDMNNEYCEEKIR